ncbi:hypothetical protein BOO86_18375 [Mycobacterium sp. CBMA 234]|uniref:ESX-1 secretion-associated protein n=1 Tax=Mycolicibacterium sp. CBMA 234 TaxID=1918495 RepID=UPI0012DD36D5|nr:ESX-1 secretion-associated protein [Mycolicibacterium sp. CBMA 234]MUL66446.1 hypothetical protein [Mycolicibacterium sp. CBMA 234]
MTDSLKVTPSDLNDLGKSHRDVASSINKAHSATDGATFTVGRTHGVVCMATISALYKAQDARTAAAEALSGFSNSLAEKLDSAASQYTGTDAQRGDELDGEMHR